MLPILTIAIPTYNGEKTIGKLIDSILIQNCDEIEILVSDNASVDGTEALINQYINEGNKISYYKNSDNVGYDRNVDLAIRRSLGEFVWTIGDDDYLAIGAIDKVIQIIKTHKDITYIYVNFSIFSIKKSQYLVRNFVQNEQSQYFENSNHFFEIAKTASNFVSTNVFRKSAWTDDDFEIFFGSGWIHFGALLKIINNKSVYYEATPYVINAGDRDGEGAGISNGIAFELIIKLSEIINQYKDYYNPKTIKILHEHVYSLVPRKLISAKINGLSLKSDIVKRFYSNFEEDQFFWTRDLLILLVPNFVFRWLRKLLRSLRW